VARIPRTPLRTSIHGFSRETLVRQPLFLSHCPRCMSQHAHSVTAVAPINIALIKYWGKADEAEMQPYNDSLSMTISSPKLLTSTRVTADPDLASDTFELNGQDRPITLRMAKCISKVSTCLHSPIRPFANSPRLGACVQTAR
jgi:hypothetical protein